MEMKGTIIKVLDKKTGTSSRGSWSIQQYVLENKDEKFSRQLLFEVSNDKIQEFNIQEGETLSVKFDPHVDEHGGRFFGKNRCYAVER